MTTWRIGTTVIHKVLEAEITVPLTGALRTQDTALLKRYPWPAPGFSRPDGTFVLSVHGLLVDTGGRRILVDTCVGNARASVPFLRMQDSAWLEDLTALGYPPEAIDTVVCTHLHFDHIGWNTRRAEGKWLPTFPRARHLVTRVEWDHWADAADAADADLDDTMRPLADSRPPRPRRGRSPGVRRRAPGSRSRAHPGPGLRRGRIRRGARRDHR